MAMARPFFATAGISAKLISERPHLLGRAERNLISKALASMSNSSGARCVFFVSTQGARDSLGEHWSSTAAPLSHQPVVRGETLRARARAERARGKHKANA